ncbi:hypothetical protein LTR28_009612 [Elasticomyces elasticus]|nr:hypothetical protein LTR28_009612 [Elasticomyces elasticus]
METVVPTIRKGGVNTVYVMPNLVPPITTVPQALDYQKRLQAIEPNVTFLMSLYLHPSITPQTVREAKAAGITGIKSYPAGLTTNSEAGVVSYEAFYPVFAAMQEHDMILNLHGEAPGSATNNITVLSAEEAFLPTLLDLHARFPTLRIVLEHCTTASAIAAVASLGPAVAATITAHHLFMTVDDWAGDPHCFCKPVAKLPSDREALLRTAVSGNPKFFLGTDSAPHPAQAKRGGDRIAAGVFTQPYAVGLVLDALEMGLEMGVVEKADVTKEKLDGFLSGFGRSFYRAPDARGEKIVLKREGETIMDLLRSESGDVEVVPFRRGKKTWSVQWQ